MSYARFSHRKQAAGSTIERQEGLLATYLEENPEITLLEQFSDRGVSGFRGRHAKDGALARLIAAIHCGRLPTPLVLIIESVDRLSREPMMDAWDRFNTLLKAGVTVAVCDMRLEIDREALSKQSWKLHSLINAMERAHGESARKSDLVSAAWRKNIKDAYARKTGIKGYVGPPWVTLDEKTQRYVITEKDQPTVQTVQRIFEWAVDGVTAHGIAKRLNEQQVPPFRAHVAKNHVRQGWYQPYITELLKNRQVLGEHRYRDGEVIEGYFEPIITPELFHRAQQAQVRRPGGAGRRGRTLSNLFTGLARCACCGGHMEMTRNRATSETGPEPIKYLLCSNRKRRFGCEAVGMLNYPKLEVAILRFLPNVPWAEIVREEDPDDPLPGMEDRIATVVLRIAELETIRSQARRMILKGEEFEEEFTPVLTEAITELRQAKTRLAELQVERSKVASTWANRPSLMRTVEDFRAKMNVLSDAERFIIRTRLSEALKEMLTKMVCDTVKKTVTVEWGGRYSQTVSMPLRKDPIVYGGWTRLRYPEDIPGESERIATSRESHRLMREIVETEFSWKQFEQKQTTTPTSSAY
ncbi:recombinase family protein [Methylorubrum aminovorans]